MRELREVKGSDNFSNFPTLYKKDKERAKKQVLYVFSPHLHLLTFFRQLIEIYRKFATSY